MQKTNNLILRNYIDDENQDLHLEFYASNGNFGALQDFYITKEKIYSFGEKLFTYSGRDSVVFEYGGDDSKWYCFVRIIIYAFKSSGHTAIEILIDNHKEKPLWCRSEFSILCSPSDINRLGRLIMSLDFKKNNQLEWQAQGE